MNRLCLTLVGLAALGSCAPVVSGRTALPSVGEVHNQQTYCTNRISEVDFGLSYAGDVNRVEVYATRAGSGPPGFSNAGQFVGGGSELFTLGAGHVAGAVAFEPQRGAGVQVVPSSRTAARLTVNPAQRYDLYFRVRSASGDASPFVQGQPVAPDDTLKCDPQARY